MKKEYWNIIKPFIPSILAGFGLMALVLLLKPGFVWLISGVMVFTLFFGIRSGKGFSQLLFSVVVNCLFFLFIYIVWVFIGGYGVLGLVVACLLVVGVLLYRRRKLFMDSIRSIEKLIWGNKK